LFPYQINFIVSYTSLLILEVLPNFCWFRCNFCLLLRACWCLDRSGNLKLYAKGYRLFIWTIIDLTSSLLKIWSFIFTTLSVSFPLTPLTTWDYQRLTIFCLSLICWNDSWILIVFCKCQNIYSFKSSSFPARQGDFRYILLFMSVFQCLWEFL